MSFRSYTAGFIKHTYAVLTVVIVVVLMVAVGLLTVVTERLNQNERDAEQRRLAMALHEELTRAQQELATVMSGRTERASAGQGVFAQTTLETRFSQAWQYFGFNSVYAIDAGGMVIAGAEHGAPSTDAGYRTLEQHVVHLLKDVYRTRKIVYDTKTPDPINQPHNMPLGGAAFIFDGFSIGLAVVIPVNPGIRADRNADVVVGVRNWSTIALRDVGDRYGLRDLQFRKSSPNMEHASFPVFGADGYPVGALVWKPSTPGSNILPQLLLVGGGAVTFVGVIFVALYGRVRRMVLDFTREEEAQQKLATLDHMTGLLNRRSFHQRTSEEIARCERNGLGFALHIVDLDRFKAVNDSLGHKAGDVVIREAAARIADAARANDVVGRLGGDEFAILQIETSTTLEAGVLATRIRDSLRKPISVAGGTVDIGCSIGIVIGPIEDHDADGLLALADSALYEAKNDGRNRHRFFESSINQSLKMKQLVEEELREAISNDQLELHYQPQVSADGSRIVGVEALVRWRHPTRGLIPPLDFIALAEERGLIIPLNEWVLRRACEDGKRWPGVKVSVNISAPQFKQANFVRDLLATVDEIGFDKSMLELELTESMIVDDEATAESAIYDLRSNGIRMALDDFGTGYSSLIYLRRFSFDKIKIDRSFLESMESTGESAILIHSVVHLGRALGLTVCAEGVETDEQRRFLQAVGCHELQGYVFSKPVLAAEIDTLLARAEPFRQAA